MPRRCAPRLRPGHIGILSSGIARIAHLEAFLGAPVAHMPRSPKGLCAMAGWGVKDTAKRARRLAEDWGLPYLSLEDGFYRSLDLGVRGAQPLSLVMDPVGVYYDAARPSHLENLLEGRAPGLENPGLLGQARELMARIVRSGLSKYNHAPDLAEDAMPDCGRSRVLVVDQTRGDLSVLLGGAAAHSFAAMLAAAVAENPGAEIWVKVHPDVLAGKKRGYLFPLTRPGVRLIAADAAPFSVLRRVDRVYTVSSQLGFEALLLGLPVTCFGLPFYSGWGATDDRQLCPRRTRRRSPEEIFAAACLLYACYVDPFSGQPCGLSRVLDVLELCRRRNQENAGHTVCMGFQRWKRPFARAFLHSTHGVIDFISDPARALAMTKRTSGRLVVWASAELPGLEDAAASLGTPLWRMEDGFLRSSGLGSDFKRPYSLIMDRQGIYYDPARESGLERLLNVGGFAPGLLVRAARLRRTLVKRGLTKYNQGGLAPDFSEAGERRILLVPGQVADDASVRLGGGGLADNQELLAAVRRARPEAYLVYKPHPDVQTGNRKGRIAPELLRGLCDFVVRDVSMARLLDRVHEVHTLSSLTGFEALLRRLPVFTYGCPFYAGWGLTTDREPFPRRVRAVSLDELVAAALLLYPLYYDWRTGLACGVEVVADRLDGAAPPRPLAASLRRVRRWLEYLFLYAKG